MEIEERNLFDSRTYAKSLLVFFLHGMNAPEVWQLCPAKVHNESERFKLRSHDYNLLFFATRFYKMNYSICLLLSEMCVRAAYPFEFN